MKSFFPLILAIVGIVAGLYLFVSAKEGIVRPSAPCLGSNSVENVPPYLIAARGAPDHRPSSMWVGFTMSGVFEHTLPAYHRAKLRGLKGFDAALRLSSDGQVILMEDDDVVRSTDGDGLASDLSWETLEKLDAGGGASIPLLGTLLEELQGGSTFHLRLPPGESGLKTAYALGAGLGAGLKSPVWVSSSDPEVLVEARRGAPKLRPVLQVNSLNHAKGLIKESPPACILALEAPLEVVDGPFMDFARAHDLRVIAKGVEDQATWEQLKALGVHAALTSFTTLKRDSSPSLPAQGMVETME